MRASHADLNPPLLAAPEIAPAGYRLPRPATVCCFATKNKSRFVWRRRIGSSSDDQKRFRKGALGQFGGRLFGGEERKACGPARSALKH